MALAFALLSIVGGGCGGGTPPAQAPTLDYRLIGAGVLVQGSGDAAGSKLSDRLLQELARLGYRVVGNENEHHDLVADVRHDAT